jgi:ribonucleotide reductase beta subunit family protein with ferritin-like domain
MTNLLSKNDSQKYDFEESIKHFTTSWYNYANNDNIKINKPPSGFKYMKTDDKDRFVPIYSDALSVSTAYADSLKKFVDDNPHHRRRIEPLLVGGSKTIFPLPPKYNAIYESYKQQQANFWTADEIDFSGDIGAFAALPEPTKDSIKAVFAFFAQSDQIIADTIKDNMLPYIKEPVLQTSYGFKAMMEDIHTQTYQRNLLALVPDDDERIRLLEGVESYPSVKLKAEWAKKWGSDAIPFAYRVFAQACTEGIQFSGSFMFVDYLSHANIKLPGTQAANTAISRDEGFHTIDAGLIYDQLKYVVPPADAFAIVDECVQTEVAFMKEVIGDKFPDFKLTDIERHIKYCANIVINSILGYTEPYPGATCPFGWMNKRDLATVMNMFEIKNNFDYVKSNISTSDMAYGYSAKTTVSSAQQQSRSAMLTAALKK